VGDAFDKTYLMRGIPNMGKAQDRIS